MKITNMYTPNFTPHVRLTKVESLSPSKCWEIEDDADASEEPSKFSGIADWTKESKQYKEMLSYFKLPETSNNEIYELISSEYLDKHLHYQK